MTSSSWGRGAGGGTLAHTLAPSGKRILLLERGDFLTRETDNWDPGRSSWTGAISRPTPGTAPTASRSSRRCTTSSAVPPSSTVRRCTGCAPGTSGNCGTWTGSRRPGRSPTTTSSRGTPGPSGSTRCTATTARTRPRATASKHTRGLPVSHENRIQQIHDGLAQGGYHPFHAPCGILLDEAHRPASACIRCAWCDGYPCLVHAKSDADVDRGPAAARPAQRHPAHRRRGDETGDRRGRARR